MRSNTPVTRAAGFTLVEIMVVVAVLAVVTTMAMPGITEAKKRANETSAIATLKQVSIAQNQYRLRYGSYGSFADLVSSNSMDDSLSDLARSGYDFGDAAAPTSAAWAVLGTPQLDGVTGDRHFFINTSGVIYYEDGAPADQNSTPID